MTGVFCPIDGCEKHHDEWNDDGAPFENVDNAAKHLRAKTDDAHYMPEQEFRDLLDADGSDDQQEQDGEEDEPAESEENDQQDDADESTDDQQAMPTEEEYDQQHGSTETTTEAGDGAETDGDDADQEASSESSGFLPKMSTRTMVYFIGFLLVIFLLFKFLSDRDGESTAETTAEDPEEEDDQQETTTDTPLIEDD